MHVCQCFRTAGSSDLYWSMPLCWVAKHSWAACSTVVPVKKNSSARHMEFRFGIAAEISHKIVGLPKYDNARRHLCWNLAMTHILQRHIVSAAVLILRSESDMTPTHFGIWAEISLWLTFSNDISFRRKGLISALNPTRLIYSTFKTQATKKYASTTQNVFST